MSFGVIFFFAIRKIAVKKYSRKKLLKSEGYKATKRISASAQSAVDSNPLKILFKYFS